jgi:hypothetical protein
MSTPQAVPWAYASSYCDATVAELTGEERYMTTHAHRCTGEHGEKLGVVIHSCRCTAEFYFVEDMLDLIIRKMEEQEGKIDVTSIDMADREYAHTESVSDTEPTSAS